MEQFFAGLTPRQTMTLLTFVMYEGQEALEVFDHLPDDEGAALRQRAQEIFKIPRERRVQQLTQAIRRLMTSRRNLSSTVEPERLARLLHKERPALVNVVLNALPAETARAVRSHLPRQPDQTPPRKVNPRILEIIRWKLEEALQRSAMSRASSRRNDEPVESSRKTPSRPVAPDSTVPEERDRSGSWLRPIARGRQGSGTDTGRRATPSRIMRAPKAEEEDTGRTLAPAREKTVILKSRATGDPSGPGRRGSGNGSG